MKSLPDKRGYFGEWGGTFVPETLMAPLEELDRVYRKAQPTIGPSKRGSMNFSSTTWAADPLVPGAASVGPVSVER